MNQVIVKKTAIFSLMLGACIGLVSLIPALIGLALFILIVFSSVIVMLYMKKDEKHLAYLTTQQGAILGAISGFFSTIGFFVIFSPMVCILHLIFKTYYAYTIPDMLRNAIWLFFVVVFIVAFVFAAVNSVSNMGLIWFLNRFGKQPENIDARLDIKIEE